MMLHGAQSPAAADGLDKASPLPHKRKAETQDNERLSKRLSLLNIEQTGSKLYVPVESPSASAPSSATNGPMKAPIQRAAPDDTMQVDDSKHKVYIYNIDDELSEDSDVDDGKLVFLPDIEKHLRASRIPPSILVSDDGDSAGMEVILYSDPKSLTVPEDRDSVRKAIIESRRRVREEQRQKRQKREAKASANANAVDTAPTNVDGVSVPKEAFTEATLDDPDAMDVD